MGHLWRYTNRLPRGDGKRQGEEGFEKTSKVI